jgi:hypothetical protein
MRTTLILLSPCLKNPSQTYRVGFCSLLYLHRPVFPPGLPIDTSVVSSQTYRVGFCPLLYLHRPVFPPGLPIDTSVVSSQTYRVGFCPLLYLHRPVFPPGLPIDTSVVSSLSCRCPGYSGAETLSSGRVVQMDHRETEQGHHPHQPQVPSLGQLPLSRGRPRKSKTKCS